jgi:hypothetical protein
MALTDYVIMPGADYQAACDAIRAKTKKTDLIKSSELANEISSLTSGLPLEYKLTRILSEPSLTFTKGSESKFPNTPCALIFTGVEDFTKVEKILHNGESGLVIFDNELYAVVAHK